jgi:tetratricopeptide (TPR) repeat protein
LWSEQIDSTTDDIIGLQDTITNRIVTGLKGELETSSPPSIAVPVTGNSLAYIEYLRGRDQLRRYMFHTVANKNVEIAIRHFTQAIELDPKFALAHSALGTCYLQKVIKIVGTRDDIQRAAAAFARALELDPQLVDARAYGALIARLQGETQKSRNELAELRRDHPNNFEVQYLSAASYRYDGDYDNALRSYEEMLRIDPTAEVPVYYCRARIFWHRGRFDLSYYELERARQIEPNHPIIKFFHAVVTFLSGNPAVAAAELRSLLLVCSCKAFQTYLAICLSAQGEFDAAEREITEECQRIAEVDPDVSYWIATAKLMSGRTDEALKWLECSIELGNHNRAMVTTDPIWMPMQNDARYAELISRMTSPRF